MISSRILIIFVMLPGLIFGCVSTSTQRVQSDEDLVKGQDLGVKYVYRGCNLAQVIFIRGDKLSEINELTLIIETQGCAPVQLTLPILAKRQEGDKLILDYKWPLDGDTYEATIIGNTLTNRKTKGWLAGEREEVYTRE